MPKFDLVPLQEAMTITATGKRAQITHEYMGFINRLGSGEAGKLEANSSESVTAIRRRLGAAAKAAGKDIVIKRNGGSVFFWVQPKNKSGTGRRRGRPRKNETLG
ncbi:MAG: hypothetical protein FJ319_04330 [SAR202 cluster bacterium]|nr:hypothetical protein [SAR202 cluster bacterium]